MLKWRLKHHEKSALFLLSINVQVWPDVNQVINLTLTIIDNVRNGKNCVTTIHIILYFHNAG